MIDDIIIITHTLSSDGDGYTDGSLCVVNTAQDGTHPQRVFLKNRLTDWNQTNVCHCVCVKGIPIKK